MIAAEVHRGTRNLDTHMDSYVWKRRVDGFYVIDLRKTWEKLVLAARVIVAIENPADVLAISARPWGQRAVLKFAKYTGTRAISGRFTPGTFTNYITKQFTEPRLLILTDPRTDHQPIRESSYVNLPTIAFCHTDSPTNHVDIVIPANNKGKHSIGLLYWLLARTVLRMRDPVHFPRSKGWDIMVDLFFYRDPDVDDAGKEGKDEEEDTTERGDAGADEEAAETPAASGDTKWYGAGAGDHPPGWSSGGRWAAAGESGESTPAPGPGEKGWSASGWEDKGSST